MKITRKPGKGEALRQAVQALDGASGKVGWLPSARYEGGQPVAGVAYVQEHGSPSRGIPPRPFFRTTAAEKQTEWAATTGRIAKAAAQGKLPPSGIMEAVCLAAEADVRDAIIKTTSPPLAEATIAARKRRLANGGAGAKASIAKPLVDTGHLLVTLTSEVK